MNIMYSIVSAMTYISNIYFLLRQIRSSIPPPVLNFLESTIPPFLKINSNKITLMIEEYNGISRDELYDAADLYLSGKISPNADLLKVAKYPRENHFTIKFEAGGKVIDSYQGIQLEWEYCDALDKNGGGSRSFNSSTSSGSQTRHFKLRFDKEYRQRIIDSYFPHVIAKSKAIRDCRKSLKLCTLGSGAYGSRNNWDTINFDHASTFDTLAMDPEMKKDIKDDLDRFVRRRDFYRRVGRAWKRGYLLYGPPGTGKSSLIAAIANYLKFDVYDLQLGNLMGDSEFRRVLLATANRSILAIEDIDCSVKIRDRSGMRSYHGSNKISNHSNDSDDSNRSPEVQARMQLSLSGLLNFIDGLWSSCGDERIIIFTTNHKERIDPALLRPGRMDKHIHMSYLTAPGFRTLASNYLDLKGQPEHRLFRDIERLIEITNVSPAQVAEELMRSEDVDIALEGVVRLLERKKMEDKEAKIEDDADGCIDSVGPMGGKILENESKK